MKLSAKSLALVALFATGTSAAALPKKCSSFGSSICGYEAKYIASQLGPIHNNALPGCRFKRAISARILSGKGRFSKEEWKIEACDGRVFNYVLGFERFGGGINITVDDAFEENPDSANKHGDAK